MAAQLTLGLLPEPGTRWGRFVLSYGVQSLVMAFFVVTAIVYPEVLVLPVHDYHFVSLVSTPPPVPQTPAPVKHFPLPLPQITEPKITEPVTPRPEAMRVPAELVRKKQPLPEEKAPKVTLAAKKELLPDVKPEIPRPPVKTNVFSNGSSATPTMAAAPSKVQTGGFGDPNGVPATENHGRPVTIAQAGSYDMPYGPGSGNGTGGAHGVRGVVASTGFGSGVATGNSSGISGSRGTVRQAASQTPTSRYRNPKPNPPNLWSKLYRLRSHLSPVRFTLRKDDSLKFRARFCCRLSFLQPGRFAS